MKNYIKKKTVLITGATSGIGRELSFDLAKMDVNLVLCARDTKKLEKVKKDILKNLNTNIALLSCDVRNSSEVENKMSSLLKNINIDILINSAGLALGLDGIDNGKFEDWNIMIDTNIKGLLYVSRFVIPCMKKLDTAHIVNLGSIAGKTAYPKGNIYCATKAAVHSLSESMNLDLAGTNIKVTTIAPGAVKTNFSNIRFKGDKKEAEKVYDGYKPLNASDISQAIISVINTPKHVNIQFLEIMPTAQRNPYVLSKDKIVKNR